MKKRYLYFLPAGIAVVLLTGLFYNRPAADTATPAAAETEGQRISEEDIETETMETETIEAQSECEISETETEIFSASSEEYPNYIEAYLEKINECEQESEDLKYDLIYLDEDDIPELVVGEPGYYVSLYMYDAGTLYTVLDRWPYGAMGNGGYEYYPKTNIISNYNSDFGGNAKHITYYKINEDFQDELYYGLSIWTFDPEGQYSDEDDFENETYYYYYNGQEITKEEFDSYLINDDYDSIVGSKTASEILSQLQTQEIITQ